MKNKLGKNECIKLVAKILTESYGSTLMEYGTDVQMAIDVINGLGDALSFHHEDVTDEELEAWREKREYLLSQGA